MKRVLEVETPLLELEEKIKELKNVNQTGKVDLSREIEALERKAAQLKKSIYENLSPWEKVLLARHPERPTSLDYVQAMFTDFFELHGDRLYADDAAIIGGFAYLEGRAVMVIGHQKGKETKENLARNFGMPNPEGFRKASRLMKLAETFNVPIITFIDTPGAYPGIEAEERGQYEAIASNIALMTSLSVPILVTVIGKGEAAAHWRSVSAIASSCSSTLCTRSSRRRAARRSCGVMPLAPRMPRSRFASPPRICCVAALSTWWCRSRSGGCIARQSSSSGSSRTFSSNRSMRSQPSQRKSCCSVATRSTAPWESSSARAMRSSRRPDWAGRDSRALRRVGSA